MRKSDSELTIGVSSLQTSDSFANDVCGVGQCWHCAASLSKVALDATSCTVPTLRRIPQRMNGARTVRRRGRLVSGFGAPSTPLALCGRQNLPPFWVGTVAVAVIWRHVRLSGRCHSELLV